ncbi:MAG: diacylglycerol kinase family lipid kinase [Crocinitomicaceae bacterium]
MRQIAFIINPISGVGKKNSIPPMIQKHLDHEQFQYEIFYTEYRGHAYDIALNIAENNAFHIIAVVGGDGSVNEVGRALVDTEIAMAIIPTGSGNGFARHFDIPCDIERSIKLINQAQIQKVDTGMINEHHFFATCGLGFDARVTHKFDEIEKRGFFGYVKAIWEELNKCENIPFQIKFGSETKELKTFVLTIANTTQYGNEFSISPESKAQDGILELVSIQKPSWWILPEFLFKAFTRNLSTYKYFESFQAKQFIVGSQNLKGHVDGDPIMLQEFNEVKVLPNSLQLMFIESSDRSNLK